LLWPLLIRPRRRLRSPETWVENSTGWRRAVHPGRARLLRLRGGSKKDEHAQTGDPSQHRVANPKAFVESYCTNQSERTCSSALGNGIRLLQFGGRSPLRRPEIGVKVRPFESAASHESKAARPCKPQRGELRRIGGLVSARVRL